ncbi:UNVERIFIED_CONTAM: hypothetical protein HDU68_003659 [Siphonaria sp. JEL0065]|nr:hypothetical protein HDU68_003659 [Siphonaria sp. JEL0065]
MNDEFHKSEQIDGIVMSIAPSAVPVSDVDVLMTTITCLKELPLDAKKTFSAPDISALRPQTTKRLSKMDLVAPSAEFDTTNATPLLKKAVIPAIKKVVESDLLAPMGNLSLSSKKIPIVLKFRDGARIKLSVAADNNIVDCVRDRLVHKYGRVKGSQMAILTHGSKKLSQSKEPSVKNECEAEETSVTSHLPVRLDSEELAGLTVWEVFDESGGLVFVE